MMRTSMSFLLILLFLNVQTSLCKEEEYKVYVVSIHSAIGSGLREHISRAIRQAQEDSAHVILFDINTPGGAVSATSDIVKIISESGIPSIAYVNNEAISAGAIIALACDKIAMVPGGTIGDAQPIPTNEKTVSYVRGKIYSIAEKQGRNPEVAISMVDKDVALVRLKDGKLKALSPEEYSNYQKRGDITEVISPIGNVLTLSTDKAIQLGIADISASRIEDLLAQINLVRVSNKHMLVTNEELKVLKGIVLTNLSKAKVTNIHLTIPEKISIFITHPLVSSLLLAIGILGLIIEFKTTGWGVAGSVGLIALALFFGGHIIARIDAGIGLIIFLIGTGLLMVEIFLIPGFGITGVLGIILILFGALFTIDTKTNSWAEAFQVLGQSLVIILVLGGLAIYFLPKTSLWKTTVLQAEERTEDGFVSSDQQSDLLGKVGVTVSQLRPSGVAIIDDKRINVISDGSFVDKDVLVKVIKVEGGKVVVRPV